MIYSKQIERISTGSKNLDDLLLGGIETHAITEFYGSPGAGKSQLCHTLAMMTAQKKKNGKVIYIDTESKFRPERLVTIACSRGLIMDTTNWLSNILHVNAMTSYQQEQLFLSNSFNSLLENEDRPTSLLIVDSIINNYRAEFLGPSNLAERQQRLYRLMNLLSRMAQNYGVAVVITNQVNSSHPNNVSHRSNSTGGSVVDYMSNYRVYLRRYINDRTVATIVKSPYHLEGKTTLTLTEKGIVDYNW
jgi:DNA repair protein RadA